MLAGTVTQLSSALREEVDGVVGSLREMRDEHPGWPVQGQPAPDPVVAPEPEAPPPRAEAPEPAQVSEPEPVQPQPTQAREPEPPQPEPTQERDPEPAASDPQIEPSPELTELFREQITNMRREGKSIEEAERVLLRFRLGHRFLDMLDEIYSSDPKDSAGARKGGLLGKFRGRP